MIFNKVKLLSAILILSVSIAISSCEKFVDIKKTSGQGVADNVNNCQAILDTYGTMNFGYPIDGEASADDYYVNDAGFLLSSVTQTDRDLYTWAPGAIRPLALPQWQNPYKVIFCANLVLEAVDKLKSGDADKSILNRLRGSALFFRAYSFWQVAQLYAKPYSSSTSNQDPGIPLKESSDINDKSVRGTVALTYEHVIKDLTEASQLLENTSALPFRPNKAAAFAMLARVYLSMENYTNALTSANYALSINNKLLDYNSSKISKTSSTPFSPRFNDEVIFHSVMVSIPILNPGTGSSNVAKIDPALVASYAANDLRKQVFLKLNTGANAGTYRFSGNYEGTSSATLFNGLATDEVYLIRAECLARTGDIGSALADLNTLLVNRWIKDANGNTTYVNMSKTDPATDTQDEVLAKVLDERRKELLMRGLRWTDLRRLNKDPKFAKTLSRSALGTTYTLPPDDPRYVLLIPQEVITNSEIAQNVR